MRVGKRSRPCRAAPRKSRELAEAGAPDRCGIVRAVPRASRAAASRYVNIDMAYGNVQVLHDVSLKVEPGHRHLPDRAIRLGQIDLAALPEPPR